MTKVQELQEAVSLMQQSHPSSFMITVSLPETMELEVIDDYTKQLIIQLIVSQMEKAIKENSWAMQSPAHQPPVLEEPLRLRTSADGAE